MSSTAAGESGSSNADRGSSRARRRRRASRGPARGNLLEPLRDERAQARRKRDVHAVHADGAFDERAPQLEREERIPARRLVHAHERRSRQVAARADPRAADGSLPTESGSTGSRVNDAKARSSSSGASTGRPRTVARTPTGCARPAAAARSREPPPSSRRPTARRRARAAAAARGERPHDRLDGEPEDARLRRRSLRLAQQQCDLESAALKRQRAAAAPRSSAGANRSPTVANAIRVSD